MAEMRFDDRENKLALNRRKFLGYFSAAGLEARSCREHSWP